MRALTAWLHLQWAIDRRSVHNLEHAEACQDRQYGIDDMYNGGEIPGPKAVAISSCWRVVGIHFVLAAT